MLRSQGEALVGIYFQGLLAPVCKHLSQNSIKQQVSKMANLVPLLPQSALSWLILSPRKSFQTSLRDKAEQAILSASAVLQREGEAGAGRCLGPSSRSIYTHHQQAESRVRHQLHSHGLLGARARSVCLGPG